MKSHSTMTEREKMTEGYLIEYNNGEDQCKQSQIDLSINKFISDMEYSLTFNHDKQREEHN